MEASCYYCPTKAHNFSSSFFTPKPKYCSIPSPPIQPQQLSFSRCDSGRRLSNRGSIAAAIGCVKVGPATTEVERELEEEMKGISAEDGIGGKWREKCKEGGGGIVELMECLEREAITGEDEGREPNDYNRRAIIFDKSARVFQALKEKDDQKS